MTIVLDMYISAVLGIVALGLGKFLNQKVKFLSRICIPVPVSGGIVISLVTLVLYLVCGIQLQFNNTIKDICMLIFFTTVGFQSNLGVFKAGGSKLLIMVGLVALLIVLQNFVGVSLARVMNASPLLGLACGSITMCGGHGTAAGFTTLIEESGLRGAGSIMMAAATFGLIAGSLIGGPMGERLIEKYGLCKEEWQSRIDGHAQECESAKGAGENLKAVAVIFIAIGLGSLLNKALALTGLSFPTYFGALIMAAVLRNVSELVSKSPKLAINEITSIGDLCLSLFLGMAMVSLRLWELSGVALPLLVVLLAQAVLLVLYARYLAFPLLGRDYDAAMMTGGLCGFGLGATPNAMANMTAISIKYRYSSLPFIIVPIVGAMFLDIINVLIVSAFHTIFI